MPTCMLLDFQMPGMNGVELQRTLRSMNVEFPIIFMSGNAHQSDVINAWHGGAVDFILKPFNAEQISEVLATQFGQLQSNREVDRKSKNLAQISGKPITKREAEVLHLLGKGLQQNEIAQSLGISLRTVKMYRSFLKNKLDLNTPAEVVRYFDQNQQSILKIAQGRG